MRMMMRKSPPARFVSAFNVFADFPLFNFLLIDVDTHRDSLSLMFRFFLHLLFVFNNSVLKK